MQYIQQFADPSDADIIMGHVMRENPNGEVQVTLLAAGMETPTSFSPIDTGVFYSAPSIPIQEFSEPLPPQASAASPVELDDIDLDIPTFLRRKKGS